MDKDCEHTEHILLILSEEDIAIAIRIVLLMKNWLITLKNN